MKIDLVIPTEMNHFAEAAPEHQRRLLDTLTLRRWGGAQDVANLVCFLASDLAGYITGTTLDVDGGLLAANLFPNGLPGNNRAG